MSRHPLRTLLGDLDDRRVAGVYGAWCAAPAPADRAVALRELAGSMADEERVEARLKALPKKLSELLDVFLREPGHPRDVRDIAALAENQWASRSEVEASLAALEREGLLFALGGASGFAVPDELADCVAHLRRRQVNEVRCTLTLKGFLHARFFDERQIAGDPGSRAAEHEQKMYKIYLLEESIAARVARLPPAVLQVWDTVLGKHGGLMPVEDLSRELDTDEQPDLELVKKCLEESMLGTVAPLRLARFGIQPCQRAVVAFGEIALACLQDHALRFPVVVEDVWSCGVDVVSNLGRFLREIGRSKVQFTVEGRLYKASERRIIKGLLPVRGALLEPERQMRFIYRFCLSRRLLDRSGERALRPTDLGRDFDQQPLLDKLGELLSYCIEERGLPGEDFHQMRLRRILLRLLERVESETWHELTLLPFLARNSYLMRLEELHVEAFFAARFKTGGYLPSESIPQMYWSLLRFLKRRLYPLGLVELGVRGGRPVAVRLSRLGAELLGAMPAGESGGERSEVIVNPDFEILLFPGCDEHAVVHAFDRFAERRKSDRVHHFVLSRSSLQAAVRDGMAVDRVLRELTERSRAPLPQNVAYTLADWAAELAPGGVAGEGAP